MRNVLRRILPPELRARLRRWLATGPGGSLAHAAYQQRLAAEQAVFAGQVEVHDLPPIFHYWSNRYLRPIIEEFGFSHPEHFFEVWLAQAYDRARERAPDRPVRFVSLGSGNCDAEVRIAAALAKGGRTEFRLECLDINPAMLERGRAHAA